jgi:uncharacterized protein YndB with AHSA1/START domain
MSERTIERTMEFDATPERVWKAISDPAELSRWFGDDTLLDLTVGGDGAMVWDRHGSFAVRVVEVDPPRRLAWRWVHEADVAFDDAPSTLVEWTVTPRDGGGAVLHLRESGFLTDHHHQQNTEGWTEELAELQALLAS